MKIEGNPILKQLEDKEAHLKKTSDALSDGLKSTENYLIADNETLYEIGRFSPDYDPDKYDGIAIRTRRDVLEAKLNTKDILDRITFEEDGKKMDQFAYITYLLKEIRTGVIAVFVVLLFIFWKLT